MGHAGEPVLIQAFLAQAAIEGLDLCMLIGLARFDQAQRDPACVGPRQHRAAATLGAVVRTEHPRQPTRERELIQDARHGEPAHRAPGFDRHRLRRCA